MSIVMRRQQKRELRSFWLSTGMHLGNGQHRSGRMKMMVRLCKIDFMFLGTVDSELAE